MIGVSVALVLMTVADRTLRGRPDGEPGPVGRRPSPSRPEAHNTDLARYLHELGVTQVVITGVDTSVGVESTARQAHEHGFHVTLATDAVTDVNAAAHDNSIQHVFPRLGETGTTDDVLALLSPDLRS